MDWNWYHDKHDSESDDVYIENWYQNHEVSDYSADKHSRFTLERHFVTVCFVVLYKVSKFIGYCSKKCD